MRLLAVLLGTFFYLKPIYGQFEVPEALVEVFRPRGLRVSIPDQEGIKLFAFHAKINEEMNGREGGTFSRDIVKAKNGRWTFYDPQAQLKVGDIIYYWTYVDYFDGKNKLGYTNDDQQFVVKELLDKDGSSGGSPVTSAPQPTIEDSCKSSATTVKNQKVCSGNLIFSEDFSSMRADFWRPEIRFASGPDYEFVLYHADNRNLQIEDGKLKIRPILSDDIFHNGFSTSSEVLNLGNQCTGVPNTSECVQQATAYLILPPVTSAQITTKNKWSFKFGTIEIKAKLPKGDWIYPELYLNSANEEYGPEYGSGQIRIAFLGGNNDLSNRLQAGCVLGNSQSARTYYMREIKKTDGSWGDSFHTFRLIWRPDNIEVSVDDRSFGSIHPPIGGFITESHLLGLKNVDRWRTGSRFAPFDKEMYLTIGVGVGGHCFEDRSDGTKPWKNFSPKGQKNFYKASSEWKPTWSDSSVLQVEYVKIWAL